MRLPLLASILAAPALLAQEPAPPPRLALESLDGTVREVDAETFRVTDPRTEGAVFVRYLGLGEPAAETWPAGETVSARFRNGDHLTGRVHGGSGDRLELLCAGDALLVLSIDDLSGLVFEARVPRDGSVELMPAEEGDRLYRVGGRGLDRIDGLVSAFDSEGVVFESRLGERTYDWDSLAALFIEDLLEGTAAGEGEDPRVPVVVSLRDGGRLSGRLVELDGNGCTLALRGRTDLALAARILQEVAVDDGSFRFLSQLPIRDLGPLSPWGDSDDLGLVYPPRLDRAFNDSPLRAGGRTYARGIGVHAPSRLTWDLAGAWKELRLGVAVDDQVLEQGNQRGSVVFRVLVDGRLAYESPVVRGGGDLVEVPPIPVAGARELVLEVDPGDDHVMDRADWLRPILVRS